MKIENNIRKLRINSKKKQKELFEYLGVANSTYSKYENGKLRPSIEILKKIADFYKIELEQIIDTSVTPEDEYFEITASLNELKKDIAMVLKILSNIENKNPDKINKTELDTLEALHSKMMNITKEEVDKDFLNLMKRIEVIIEQ